MYTCRINKQHHELSFNIGFPYHENAPPGCLVSLLPSSRLGGWLTAVDVSPKFFIMPLSHRIWSYVCRISLHTLIQSYIICDSMIKPKLIQVPSFSNFIQPAHTAFESTLWYLHFIHLHKVACAGQSAWNSGSACIRPLRWVQQFQQNHNSPFGIRSSSDSKGI